MDVSEPGTSFYHYQTWEKELAELLALCDIRPTYKDTA
jgi:hypothetical protein